MFEVTKIKITFELKKYLHLTMKILNNLGTILLCRKSTLASFYHTSLGKSTLFSIIKILYNSHKGR